MSQTYGNFSGTLPGVGDVVWGQEANDLLQSVVDVIATRVTPAGIDLSSGDLDLKGNSSINVESTAYVEVPQSQTGSLGNGPYQYANQNGEMCWRDAAGNLVQVTAAGFLNAAISGGIGGSYAAAGAHLNYVSSNNSYTHTDANSNASLLDGGGVIMRRGQSTGYVELVAPSNIGSAVYTLTASLGLPSGRSVVTVDATGTLDYDTTLLIDARGLTLTGSVNVVGAVTASLPVTAPDHYYTTQQVLSIPAAAAMIDAGGTAFSDGDGIYAVAVSQIGQNGTFALPLRVGDTLVQVAANVLKETSNTTTLTAVLRLYNAGTSTVWSQADSTVGPIHKDIVVAGVNQTVAAGDFWSLAVYSSSGNSFDLIYGLKVYLTRTT